MSIVRIDDLDCGIAGEHLVCADLLTKGYRAFLVNQNCPYDVAVDNCGKLIRVQVKTTRYVRSVPQRKNDQTSYIWHVRRTGKNNRRNYEYGDFDVLALVALDKKLIAYMPPSKFKNTIHIRDGEPPLVRPKYNSSKYFCEFPFEKAIACSL